MSLSNIFKMGDSFQGKHGYYTIIKKLGNGGNGTAYLAVCTSGIYCGCYFVIKFLYKINDEERLSRFKREIEFLSTANHPSIIKLYESGEFKYKSSLLPYYIMEYLPRSLENELCNGKLPLEKAFLYSTQLLSAIKYLQDKGVVHRDIKPENIFINENHAILADFGLIKDISKAAHIGESERQDLEESIFSNISNGDAMPYNYRTPQLVRYLNKEGPLDPKTDIFQLGITFMRMFSGQHPLVPTGDSGKNSSVDFKYPPSTRYNCFRHLSFKKLIIDLLDGMINEDESKILPIDTLLSSSIGTFRKYLKDKFHLDGDILK